MQIITAELKLYDRMSIGENGGAANTVTYNSLAVGHGHSITGFGACILGGTQNTVSNTHNIVGGQSNTVTNTHNMVTGLNNIVGGQHNLVAGQYNTANSTGNVIAGGYQNVTGGSQSFVTGDQNTVSATRALVIARLSGYSGSNGIIVGENVGGSGSQQFALGGIVGSNSNYFFGFGSQVTSGAEYGVGFGDNNTMNATHSTVFGKYGKTLNYGQFTQASGRFAAQGDAQSSVMVARVATTDDTETEMPLDGGSTYLTIENNKVYAFVATIVGVKVGDVSERAMYRVEWLTKRDAGVATVTVDGLSVTTVYETTASMDANVTADTTNGRPAIKVKGLAATNMRWVAKVEMTEVAL